MKIVFSNMIGRAQYYNCNVHYIYILCTQTMQNFNWKIYSKHFWYIITLTLHLPYFSEGVVHFELTVSIAMLFSSIWPFIWYTYWGQLRGCLQLHRQQFRWRWDQTTDFRFKLRGIDYPRDDREKVNNSTIHN